MSSIQITRNGQDVECYGQWEEDSNALIIYEYPDGECDEDIFADGANNWTEAVEKCTAWAKRNNVKIVEMQSC